MAGFRGSNGVMYSDSQRMAIFSGFNRFAKSSSREAAKLRSVASIEKKIAPLLAEGVDIQGIDVFHMYDSSLKYKENLDTIVSDLRNKGLLESALYVPSKREDLKHMVSGIVFNNVDIEEVYDGIKDDKFMMSGFRNEMLRAIFGNMLNEEDHSVRYLAEHDKTFEKNLYDMLKSRNMSSSELVSADIVDTGAKAEVVDIVAPSKLQDFTIEKITSGEETPKVVVELGGVEKKTPRMEQAIEQTVDTSSGPFEVVMPKFREIVITG